MKLAWSLSRARSYVNEQNGNDRPGGETAEHFAKCADRDDPDDCAVVGSNTRIRAGTQHQDELLGSGCCCTKKPRCCEGPAAQMIA